MQKIEPPYTSNIVLKTDDAPSGTLNSKMCGIRYTATGGTKWVDGRVEATTGGTWTIIANETLPNETLNNVLVVF